MVTPFTAKGAIDESALRTVIDWQIDEGIHFLVPCGSTGEAATMTIEEHRRVVEITVEQVKGRVPVVAGAGSNDTVKAIALSKLMKETGATHLLHTSPMYNKPPQRGIVAHYRAIADAVDLPIVVYNVPGRTGSNIEAKTTIEMAAIKGIHAVKEASGNLNQISDVIRGRPQGFVVLYGEDALTLPVVALGGDGIIAVV
jgi:4-hydroxy-tetrahydrodipicolinate synthase